MAYGDIELVSATWNDSWRKLIHDAIDRASWPGSDTAVPIRRNGLKIAYVVGADYLDRLEKAAAEAVEVMAATIKRETGEGS